MKEIKALLPFVKPYRWTIALAVLCMIAVTVMNLASPWMVRTLISTVKEGVSGEADYGEITFLAVAVIIIYLLRAFAQFGTNYVSHYAAWHMLKEIRQYIYDHMQRLSLRFFQNKQTGELMSRVINDTRNFEQLLATPSLPSSLMVVS